MDQGICFHTQLEQNSRVLLAIGFFCEKRHWQVRPPPPPEVPWVEYALDDIAFPGLQLQTILGCLHAAAPQADHRLRQKYLRLADNLHSVVTGNANFRFVYICISHQHSSSKFYSSHSRFVSVWWYEYAKSSTITWIDAIAHRVVHGQRAIFLISRRRNVRVFHQVRGSCLFAGLVLCVCRTKSSFI